MTYQEAVDIRLRAAQHQYVSADELAEAQKVVAYTRTANLDANKLADHGAVAMALMVQPKAWPTYKPARRQVQDQLRTAGPLPVVSLMPFQQRLAMSTRTIIEINHDHLRPRQLEELIDLFNTLGTSTVTMLLNTNDGKPFNWSPAVRILGQRHHSETLKLTVE